MPKPNKFFYAGLFIVCCGLLVTEILLTRVFSVCLWYHFAFLVISITMFGLGAGGLTVQLFPSFFNQDNFSGQLFKFSLMLSLSGLIAPLALFKVNINPDYFSVFSKQTMVFVAVAFTLSALPFFFGGIITSLLFRNHSAYISRLYFTDLIGASFGCILAIPLLELLGASQAVIFNALFICLGAFFFLRADPGQAPKIHSAALFIAVMFLAGLFIYNAMTSGLDLEYAKGNDRRKDEFSEWNSISRIAVSPLMSENKTRSVAESVWGVSTKFSGKYPPARIVDIDADAGTFLIGFRNNFEEVGFIRNDPPSIVHRLKIEPRTLIIGSGGGKDVLTALSFGAQKVTAVELNPIIVNDVMLKRYRAFSGSIYANPKVRALADEGRSFIVSDKSKYDIIQLAYVDTSAATSGGAYVLAENNLYTQESFREFIKHLEREGIFSVCWVDVPGLYGGLRLISLGVYALKDLGIEDASSRIMVISHPAKPDWVIRDVLIKAQAFTREEQETVLSACRELGFSPTYIPMLDKDKVDIMRIKTKKDLVKAIINGDESQRYALYEMLAFNIRPTVDDSPFFFYQSRPKDFFKNIFANRAASYIVYTSGKIVLVRVFLIGLILVTLFFFLPMIFSSWNRKGERVSKFSLIPLLFYFSSIGLGFMLIEIVLLQKLLLFLGHPIYTLSVTLLSVLLFAGLGSLSTQRFPDTAPQRHISKIILLLVLMIVLYYFFLHKALGFFITYPKALKIIVAVVALSPLSFIMGMPLPLAVKYLHNRANKVIPWMWGMNGAASVMGSIIAIILAMNIGYNFTLLTGMVCYLCAWFSAAGWKA